MEMTLLLNATYEPLRVVNWQKAIALLWQGKVEVLEVYDREVHAVSISIKLPSVMRLLKLVRLKDVHRAVKFSRINIFTRDGYACQYCRHKFRTEELTFNIGCSLRTHISFTMTSSLVLRIQRRPEISAPGNVEFFA